LWIEKPEEAVAASPTSGQVGGEACSSLHGIPYMSAKALCVHKTKALPVMSQVVHMPHAVVTVAKLTNWALSVEHKALLTHLNSIKPTSINDVDCSRMVMRSSWGGQRTF